LAEGYVEVKALGWRGVVYALGWNYHAFGRTALLLNCVDEARHDGIAALRFDEIGEANYRKTLALAEPRYAPARHIAAWVFASSTDAPASGSPRALGHRHHDLSLDGNDMGHAQGLRCSID
jgi:hypothetical protein